MVHPAPRITIAPVAKRAVVPIIAGRAAGSGVKVEASRVDHKQGRKR